MLHFRLQIKLICLILVVLIGWNLFPSFASGAPNRTTPYIVSTTETIIKNNKLTNEFQNNLDLIHEEKYLKEVSKNIENYYNIIKPPTTIFEHTQPDALENKMLQKCNQEYKISNTDFKNLSSVCLQVRLEKLFKDYTVEMNQNAPSQEKTFLIERVKEANKLTVDFYTEAYSAYILHSQFEEIKNQIETINNRLYNVYMEVKKYPIKLPDATTTSCT